MRNVTYPTYFTQLGRVPTSEYAREGAIDAPEGDITDGVQQPTKAKAAIQELQKAVVRAHEVLVSATTVFPFTLFPDTVTVDREKITIAHRFFFRVAEVISLRIEDILNVVADVGPIFGSLKITSRFYDAKKPYHVNYLWRSDASRIKRILQGYLIARQKKIDCSSLSTRELCKALDKLGQMPQAANS